MSKPRKKKKTSSNIYPQTHNEDKILRALKVEGSTVMELSLDTGIAYKNIGRYIKTLLAKGLISVSKEGKHKIVKSSYVNLSEEQVKKQQEKMKQMKLENEMKTLMKELSSIEFEDLRDDIEKALEQLPLAEQEDARNEIHEMIVETRSKIEKIQLELLSRKITESILKKLKENKT